MSRQISEIPGGEVVPFRSPDHKNIGSTLDAPRENGIMGPEHIMGDAQVIDPGKATYKYAAFISYRHDEVDRRWAKWLHRALETYKVPSALVKRGLPPRL